MDKEVDQLLGLSNKQTMADVYGQPCIVMTNQTAFTAEDQLRNACNDFNSKLAKIQRNGLETRIRLEQAEGATVPMVILEIWKKA